jgi:hypothetical protein
MREIIGFGDRKVQKALAIAIRDALIAHGSVAQDLATLSVPADEWRNIARAAVRELGRPVQTLIVGNSVHAALRDWPRDGNEQNIHNQAMRPATDSVSRGSSAFEL